MFLGKIKQCSVFACSFIENKLIEDQGLCWGKVGTDGACPSGPRASVPAPPLRRLEFKATALAWVPAPPFSLPLGVDLPPMVWGMEHEALGGRGRWCAGLAGSQCPGSPPLDPHPWE